MFDRQQFLGQVAISPGAGFGAQPAWSVASPLPVPPTMPPPGAPALSREVISPYGWETNKHCYRCSDGTHRHLTIPEADALLRFGISCEPELNTVCAGLVAVTTPSTAVAVSPGMASSRRMGQAPSPGPGPSPGPAPSPGPSPTPGPQQGVQPITVGPGDRFDDFDFFFPGFWPGYYQYPLYYPQVPARERIVCRRDEERSEEEGRDVLVCERMAPSVPQYQYPAYTFPLHHRYPTYWIRPFWF